ncbi:hypothetical protein BIWAKO_03453 [Bosea sp. BIWAKO-01]|nr:hypothetical protein BIWAKO_03453 [Bosea sp. BIWAKO-01]
MRAAEERTRPRHRRLEHRTVRQIAPASGGGMFILRSGNR